MVSPNTPSNPGKFDNFDRMCREAKAQDIQCVLIACPQVLGDTYQEMVRNLGKLAETGLMLQVASASQQ